jgi:acetyltransferase-like isoleucine patch superfamily enzyme
VISRPDLRGPVRIAASALIGEHCTLGYPKEARLAAVISGEREVTAGRQVTIGERCLLFNHVVIYEGVQIGDDCVIEDRARIGYDSTIGSRSRIAYGAYLCDRVTIGAETRIAGFICDGTVIGDRSRGSKESVSRQVWTGGKPLYDWLPRTGRHFGKSVGELARASGPRSCIGRPPSATADSSATISPNWPASHPMRAAIGRQTSALT